MLISDSLPLLWLCYGVLSLIVLAAGYFGVSFLPRLPRWALVGLVAGLLATPSTFSVPGPENQLGYSGWAPALIVAIVGQLQHDTGQMAGAGALLLVGMGIGAALGAAIALKRRRDDDEDDEHDSNERRPVQRHAGQARREPSI
ncbi:hypothetical protein [Phytohalomonas tamaricis]|uniref:hypothetical protein n=1 Tax=Phytohalomonas tamaricis TaxID=2081032 RepID=UPI000D0BDCD3|nr:hypothetical protein [Phytohalomonas tamaricis]